MGATPLKYDQSGMKWQARCVKALSYRHRAVDRF